MVHRNPQVMSQNEIGLIQSWVSTGAKKGKCKENRSSVYAEYQKGNNINIDRSTEYRMTAPYLIPNDRRDDFRFFYIPCHLDENKFITGISFQAGNKKRVHHSRIMIDTTGLIQDINGMSELDPNISFYQRFPLADEFLYGWVPGNFSFKFPKGFGKKIHKNANIILNMHYSPSSLSEFDTSSIRFEYRSEQ